MKALAPKWTEYEDNLLREYTNAGKTDREISDLLPGRTASACSKRRHKVGIESGRLEAIQRRQGWQHGNGVLWKPEEDVVIRRVIADGGKDRDIADILTHRSIKSINARRMSLRIFYPNTPPKVVRPPRKRIYKPRTVLPMRDRSILHLVDLMRAYNVQTIGEAKALYRERNELNVPREPVFHYQIQTEGPPAQSPFAWAV